MERTKQDRAKLRHDQPLGCAGFFALEVGDQIRLEDGRPATVAKLNQLRNGPIDLNVYGEIMAFGPSDLQDAVFVGETVKESVA